VTTCFVLFPHKSHLIARQHAERDIVLPIPSVCP